MVDYVSSNHKQMLRSLQQFHFKLQELIPIVSSPSDFFFPNYALGRKLGFLLLNLEFQNSGPYDTVT